MTGRLRSWPRRWLTTAWLVVGAASLSWAAVGATGTRAYDEARHAEESSASAVQDGEETLGRLRALGGDGRDHGDRWLALMEEAEAAHRALLGYRRVAETEATEALRLVAQATRVAAAATPDPVRRETLEQHALLAAREAAVMAARARAEAERLRAVLAEARLLLGAGSSSDRTRIGPAPPGGRPPRTGVGAGRDPGEVEVPNVVGSRLDAARRDLEAAGLRLGGVTGPADGFVVRQAPESGARVPRLARVAVTLSATAATTTPGR